jgi:hypothetical protein
MQDYVEILEAQYKSLQSLVTELLVKNQQLREELAARSAPVLPDSVTAPATHSPRRLSHSTAG